MFAYIKGTVEDIGEDSIVVECNHIGYNINVPTSVIGTIDRNDIEIKIYTYTCVREDSFSLYGFITKEDLFMFKKLITVNGIGPKGALAILSTLATDDLRFAIMAGDAKLIASAPGIGKKTAERVILDLKDKVDFNLSSVGISAKTSASNSSSTASFAKNEAVEGLMALGYSSSEAMKAINAIEILPDMDSAEIMKLALKSVR